MSVICSELIEWRDPVLETPADSGTVLISFAAGGESSLGWHDPVRGWHNFDGFPLKPADIRAWAKRPKGPRR